MANKSLIPGTNLSIKFPNVEPFPVIVDGVDENKEVAVQLQVGEGDFSLLGPRNYGHSTRHYDKPLSCFGCGIGWFL